MYIRYVMDIYNLSYICKICNFIYIYIYINMEEESLVGIYEIGQAHGSHL